MTAKEMFSNINFHFITILSNEKRIVYTNDFDDMILFDLESKKHQLDILGFSTISIALHKAIHQQMKELGWLE